MVQLRFCDIYVADFETTCNTERTKVWASGFANLRRNMFIPNIQYSIDDFVSELFKKVTKRTVVYFHNLKFDASFLLDYLLNNNYEVAFNEDWLSDKDMPNKSIKTTISAGNQWYELVVHLEGNKYIYFRDSYKLLPYALDDIGDSVGINKMSIDYGKDRDEEGIDDNDVSYLTRDIEILWKALRSFIIENKHSGMTIGSCCKSEYNKTVERSDFRDWFPNLAKRGQDRYFRDAYMGGVCYVSPYCKNKVIKGIGCTFDVNSLYPYVMENDFKYPVGIPHFFEGKVPNHVFSKDKVYFIRIRCSFNIKKGYVPFIQLKHNPFYMESEHLETSDVLFNGEWYSTYEDEDGSEKPFLVEMTLTEEDWKLFYRSYDISNLEILGGAWFWAKTGRELFGAYIKYYEEKKKESVSLDRVTYKLFLNNLAGKLAAKPESTTRVPFLRENGTVGFNNVIKEDTRRAWYIPAACFINAYARRILLTAIHKNAQHFLYCDTDSIHLDCPPRNVVGIAIDDTEFGKWKLERVWTKAVFVKQKCYIEIDSDSTPVVKCSGMSRRAKQLLMAKMTNTEDEIDVLNDDEAEFLSKPFNLKDFKVGFSIPGNLRSKRIAGGTILISEKFNII